MTSAAGDAGLLDGDEVAEGSLLALAVGAAVGVGETVGVGIGVGGGGGGGGGGQRPPLRTDALDLDGLLSAHAARRNALGGFLDLDLAESA
jgi:hypothetical protein